ncbi:MAG: DUF2029 domain-containing protein [Phycisphaerae bacterium]|nr:DUF2029 domain-containing protein [Phycisphaerae bacterium]
MGFFYAENLRRILSQGHQSDFRHFYAAAVAMSRGEDIYRSGTGGYVYPPFFAFCLLPIAGMSSAGAAACLLSITVPLMLVCVTVSAAVANKRLSIDRCLDSTPLIALLTAIVTFGRIKAELGMLQTDVFVLAAYVLALRWINRKPIWAGTVLGLALNIKYYTLPALPYLLIRRRFAAANSMIVAAIAFALLPALKLGWQNNLHDLHVAFAGVLHSVGVPDASGQHARVHDVADTLSVSVTSGLARMLRLHPSVVIPMTLLVAAIACAITIIVYRRRGLPLFHWPAASHQRSEPYRRLLTFEWAAIMLATVMFSPDANMRHLVLVLVANAIAIKLVLSAPDIRMRWLAGAALLIQILAFDSMRNLFGQRAAARFEWLAGEGWSLLLFYVAVLVAFSSTASAASEKPDTVRIDEISGELKVHLDRADHLVGSLPHT